MLPVTLYTGTVVFPVVVVPLRYVLGLAYISAKRANASKEAEFRVRVSITDEG